MNPVRLLRVFVGGSAVGGYRRIGYLIVTVGIAVATWLALSTLAAVVLSGSDGGQVRFPGIHIMSGSLNKPVPLHYMRRIESVPGTRDVNWQSLLVVACAPRTRAVLSAIGGPGTTTRVRYITGQHGHPVDSATLARWQADPLGILISRETAHDCRWRAGHGIEPSSLTGNRVSLHVTAVITMPGASVSGFAHYAYVNRVGASLAGKNMVAFAQARARSVRDNERLAAQITAAFAHDNPVLKAATDVTAQNAAARFGKVQQLLAFVMAAVLLCAVSILISVLAHSAAQRRPRFALLQVLGFGRGTLFVTVVLESALIIVIGALIGIALGLGLAHFISVGTAVGRLFTGYDFTPPSWSYRWMLPWLAGLLVAGLIAPALVIRRSRPVDHRGG